MAHQERGIVLAKSVLALDSEANGEVSLRVKRKGWFLISLCLVMLLTACAQGQSSKGVPAQPLTGLCLAFSALFGRRLGWGGRGDERVEEGWRGQHSSPGGPGWVDVPVVGLMSA